MRNSARKIENFFWQLVPTLRGPPALVRSAGGHFMDKPDNVISLINLATVRASKQQWGVEIDPLRFRANIYIDGARPWEEFDWVGSEIRIGGAVFAVDRKNGRCGATNVNPATGRRDLDIPGSLRAAFGHKNLGVYLDRARRRRDRRRRFGIRAALGASGGSRPFSAGPGHERRPAAVHVPRLLFHLRGGQRPAAAIDPAGNGLCRYSRRTGAAPTAEPTRPRSGPTWRRRRRVEIELPQEPNDRSSPASAKNQAPRIKPLAIGNSALRPTVPRGNSECMQCK